jgi:tRNA nucleotidyltransferase (CCA-adding enzyme)
MNIESILMSDDVISSIKDNIDCLLELIPEIKNMIGFEHKHPHHPLPVWDHTIEVIKNLHSTDFELVLAGLLHDIGKPFVFQEGEVRHFHGHPEKSAEMSEVILDRLGFDSTTKKNVLYLVLTHDTAIDPENLDNNMTLINKRLQLQYADARAHTPSTVPKRIALLDSIKDKLEKKEELER